MKKSLLAVGIVLCLLCLFVGKATADDWVQPPWRGLPGTTLQEWEYLTPGPNFGPPDGDLGDQNPYGPPVSYDDPGGTPSIWHNSFAGRAGVLEFIGPHALVFDLPNQVSPNPEKWIHIQTTFYSPQGYPVEQGPAGVIVAWDGGIYSSDTTPTPQSWLAQGDGWYTHIFNVILPENPSFERIEVYWNSGVFEPYYVDQVVIDTYCVPEPISLVLLALGGTVLMRRR